MHPSKLTAMNRLPLYFLLSLLSTSVLADSGSYRVELIVFRNLQDQSEALNVEAYRNYAKYPELSEDANPNELPDDLLVITQKSNRMDDIWRRLRSSNNYRPLLFSAWEQSRTDYAPPMRIHDQNLLEQEIIFPSNIVIAELADEYPQHPQHRPAGSLAT